MDRVLDRNFLGRVLGRNFLGVFKLAVNQIKVTEFTRKINALGLKKVKKSIMDVGWIKGNSLYVLVPREQLLFGKETVFTAEILKTLDVLCLDGNHRLQALRDIKGQDFEVDCRLYLHYDCAETTTALARSE